MQILDNLNISNLIQILSALLIPAIAAGIGWFTNYIAIKMLFYPRVARRILGITLHGVFPKRQKELGSKLGELFAEKLGVQKQIEEQFEKILDFQDLREELHKKVGAAAVAFINQEMPFLSSMLPQDLLNSLSVKVGDKLYFELMEKFNNTSGKINKKIDIKAIVENEINALEAQDLESLLQGLLKKEFKFIELSGAILGFLIGCLQLALSKYI